MTRPFLALLATLAFASSALAGADLEITAFTVSSAAVTTGERFTLVMRWRNNGPDTAHDVRATVGENTGVFALTGAGTEHWLCENTTAGNGFGCHGVLEAGEDALMFATVLAPSEADSSQFVARARVRSSWVEDPQPANNERVLPMSFSASSITADLAISPELQTHSVAPGSPLSIHFIIGNNGPDTAVDVIASFAFTPGLLIPNDVTADGWTCEHPEDAPWTTLCFRDQLAPGGRSRFTVNATAPSANGTISLYARVAAMQTNDPPASNMGIAEVEVGTTTPAEARTRILIPLPPDEIPGANGALWIAETTLMLRTRIETEPELCNGMAAGPQCTSDSLPIGVPMRLLDLGGFEHRRGGFFLTVREEDADQVSVSSRAWDRVRETQTAGSGLKIAHDHDFTSGVVALLGIPVAPQYRHTLRVYDLDGRDGARIALRIYANAEVTPRATLVQTLSAETPSSIYPGYLQLDPAQLTSLAGVATMRIEVEPLDEDVKIWAFVSVTNNDTHHVTTFSAN